MSPAALAAGVIAAAILLLCAILARRAAKRRPASRGVQFSALPGSSVLHDALLWDQDDRAISATVIDMAVNRKIRLIAQEVDGKRSTAGAEVVEGAQFTHDEAAVLRALFGPGNSPGRVRRFSKDRVALSKRLLEIRGGAVTHLVESGLIRKNRRQVPVVLLWIASVCAILVTGVLVIGALAQEDLLAFALAGVSLLAVIAAMAVTPKAWRRFLPASDPVRAHLAGMREYIAVAEREPLRYLQSVQGAQLRADVESDAALERFLLNERMLPYAVIFGEEKSWVRMLRQDAAGLSRLDGMDGVLDGIEGTLAIIELTGGALHLVLSLGELSDGVGGVIEGIGSLLDGL